MSTTFKGPVISKNGFQGTISLPTDISATSLTATGAIAGAHLDGILGANTPAAATATTLVASTSAAVGSGGTAITLIKRGTVSIDPASIGSAAIGETSVTITGAAVGDSVVMNPPTAGLTAGLGVVGAVVSATNTVKVRIANLSGGSVDEPAGTWTYLLIRS